jgi:hypothetical protein
MPAVIDGGIILPSSLNGLSALPAHEPADYNIDHNSEYAYQFDAILTHACQANLAAQAECDEKVAHEMLGISNNQPMVITECVTLALGYPSAPLRNYDYEWKMVLSDAYLDNCAADPKFNHTIVDAICEGLHEAGYAFATKAFNPYEALETYKELGESMASLAKGAFYLTVGRDIYILSGGKYCMSDAEMRENIYLVIDAIRKIDPHAFSAKQVGEFAGTEAAKMVHTFGLGKIIDVVGKVNMARKARSLVKKLDKVTRAAQAERAVAVTAEGFVVEAANEARAGLTLSEINNASQAEKRVAQAAAGLVQEGERSAEKAALKAGERIPEKAKAATNIATNISDGEYVFNFSVPTAKHMAEKGRTVPVQILKQVIESPMHVMPDPRGSRAQMFYSQIWKNGKLYNIEVLYDQSTNKIWHFLYEQKAMGPLGKVK